MVRYETRRCQEVSELEAARLLFAQTCDFILAAGMPEQFPESQGPKSLPEVALIGRSNVGKSSLINALTNRKKLARTSNTPGRTQQIVFFDLAHRLMLVDLPGYGHANAPPQTQKQWNNLVYHYIQKRPNLRLICLLIDGRHGILARDLEMMDFLDSVAISYQVVLTKADQVRGSDFSERQMQVEASLATHPAARPHTIATSAEKGDGIPELRQLLADFSLEK